MFVFIVSQIFLATTIIKFIIASDQIGEQQAPNDKEPGRSWSSGLNVFVIGQLA